MHAMNASLVSAFPTSLRQNALVVAEAFPEPRHPSAGHFSVNVQHEIVTIPYRLYHVPSEIRAEHLTGLEKEFVDCLLTRHHDGLVRQHHSEKIVRLQNSWVPPFVVRLLGESVIEIIAVIHRNLDYLDRSLYREFFQSNSEFLPRTAQRVASYWNCYQRLHPKENYLGFKVLDSFRAIAGSSHPLEL